MTPSDDDWVLAARDRFGFLYINSYRDAAGASPWPWLLRYYQDRPAWNEPLDGRVVGMFYVTPFFKARRGDLDALLAMERARLAMADR